jgi:hypothetical protein
MYCANCGAEAAGNFCRSCGAALLSANEKSEAQVESDWSRETTYEKLIRIPEVRNRISKSAGHAKRRLSGEEFLALCDRVVSLGIPLSKLADFVRPFYSNLGIKTGKERVEHFSARPGLLIVSTLCSLARNGQELRRVEQFPDGCLLEATLPSDIWSFEGTLYVSVRVDEAGTRVDATTNIQGQAFDWGKSTRCLHQLFGELATATA